MPVHAAGVHGYDQVPLVEVAPGQSGECPGKRRGACRAFLGKEQASLHEFPDQVRHQKCSLREQSNRLRMQTASDCMVLRLCAIKVILVLAVAWARRAGLVLTVLGGAAQLAALVLVTQHFHMLRVSGETARNDIICSTSLLMHVATEQLRPCSAVVQLGFQFVTLPLHGPQSGVVGKQQAFPGLPPKCLSLKTIVPISQNRCCT